MKWVERIWTWLCGRAARRGALLILAFLTLLTFLVPQAPTLAEASEAYSRWLAHLQQEHGPIVHTLATLGLLSLRRSLWMRLALGCLLIVAAAQGRWAERLHRRDVLFAVGALLLFAGWALNLRLGWVEEGLTAWPDTPLVATGHNVHLDPLRDAPPFLLRFPLVLRREGFVWGVEATAIDETGEPLMLQIAPQEPPQLKVRLVLNREHPEGYFALPEEALIFRITTGDALNLQLYDSGDGILLNEMKLQEGENHLFTRQAHINLLSVRLPVYRLINNPGLAPTVLGWLALLIAEVGGECSRKEAAQ